MKNWGIAILILALFVSVTGIGSAVVADSGEVSELEQLLPLADLPEKLIVTVESGTDQLYEEHDVKYAIVYMDPPETNLVIYELATVEVAEAFFEYINEGMQSEPSDRISFHEMLAYNVQSETSIFYYWMDGKQVFTVEVIRIEPLTETEITAARFMAELLFRQSSGSSGFPVVAVPVLILFILIAGVIVFWRRRRNNAKAKT